MWMQMRGDDIANVGVHSSPRARRVVNALPSILARFTLEFARSPLCLCEGEGPMTCINSLALDATCYGRIPQALLVEELRKSQQVVRVHSISVSKYMCKV